MELGQLISWNIERGFGFMRPDDPNHDDVFVHASVLKRVGIVPIVGAKLKFKIGEQGGRQCVIEAKGFNTSADDPNAGLGVFTGRLAHINEAKRIAFVRRDDGGGDVFCKFNELGRNGVPAVIGTPVVFEIGERDGPCVVAIEPLDQRQN